jgi:hypothetical protein
MRDIVLPALLAGTAIAGFVRVSRGLTLIVTFVPAMAVSLLCHVLTTARGLPDARTFRSIYLVALAVQFVHFAEEYVTGFYRRWPVEIFRTRPYDLNTFVLINMVSNAIFVLPLIAIERRVRTPMHIAWFFTLMGAIGNAVQHPIYAFKVRGYFPGLYTSTIYWVLGPMLFRALWRARRQSVARPHESDGYRTERR